MSNNSGPRTTDPEVRPQMTEIHSEQEAKLSLLARIADRTASQHYHSRLISDGC